LPERLEGLSYNVGGRGGGLKYGFFALGIFQLLMTTLNLKSHSSCFAVPLMLQELSRISLQSFYLFYLDTKIYKPIAFFLRKTYIMAATVNVHTNIMALEKLTK
jgi:hypothetical protein